MCFMNLLVQTPLQKCKPNWIHVEFPMSFIDVAQNRPLLLPHDLKEIHLFIYLGGGHAIAKAWKSEDSFQESVFSIHHWGPGTWTPVVRLIPLPTGTAHHWAASRLLAVLQNHVCHSHSCNKVRTGIKKHSIQNPCRISQQILPTIDKCVPRL